MDDLLEWRSYHGGKIVMFNQAMRYMRLSFFMLLLFAPATLYASLIESTMGTAIVNDATAVYHNPAALTLLKNPQIVALGSVAYFRTEFTGQSFQPSTGFTQKGDASTRTNYFLPTFYFATPANQHVTVGVAVITNQFNRNIDDSSVLRYVQTNNSTQDIDIIPGVGVKINDVFSVGAGVTFSRVDFVTNPIAGFPALNIPDSQSHNVSNATSIGGNVGFVLKPAPATLIGYNYRSAMTFKMAGSSSFEGMPPISTDDYNFTFWTPARSVVSVSQHVTKQVAIIGTAQHIQWSIFNNVTLHNVATQIGAVSVILPTAVAPFHLRNAWIFTLGGNYRISPQWIVRGAGSYIQSPSSGSYQLSNGDSIILGASVGYEINKTITVDGGYAHAFMKDQNINFAAKGSIITGINRGSRDSASLKLTVNL